LHEVAPDERALRFLHDRFADARLLRLVERIVDVLQEELHGLLSSTWPRRARGEALERRQQAREVRLVLGLLLAYVGDEVGAQALGDRLARGDAPEEPDVVRDALRRLELPPEHLHE